MTEAHSHSWWRHPDGSLRCGCGEFATPAPALSAFDLSEIQRFGVWDEETGDTP